MPSICIQHKCMLKTKRSREPESPEARVARKARDRKRRLIAYGSIGVVLYGAWIWQPYQVDVFPRQPDSNPPVNPDTSFLFSPRAKVLVVTAHPDDSAFYIGGFLTQLGRSGAEIHQIICTDGDKAYYWVFANSESMRPVRRAEAREELQTWHGKDVQFLGKPDGRLRADDALVKKIRQRIDELQPDYVICFDGDYPPRITHQDHRRSGDAAELAVKGAPSVKWLMKFSTHAPNWICDISNDWEAQTELLQIHKSQFHGERLERVTNMVEDLAYRDGERAGVNYGEGFRCIRLR
jgi:LmbE family N-acetylglucosaminyl deacetylase